jgi:hypothetical protein
MEKAGKKEKHFQFPMQEMGAETLSLFVGHKELWEKR